jgi:transmembrane sensor
VGIDFSIVVLMKNHIMTELNFEEINALIAGCLSGSATEEQFSQLNHWVSSSMENQKHYQQMKNLWDLTQPEIGYTGISTEKAVSIMQHRINRMSRRTFYLRFLQRAAAILFLPLLAGSFFFGKSNRHAVRDYDRQMVYNEVSASFGTRSALTLSDGSRVWLNSGSKLKYPDRFDGKLREVFLTGEGYFEVKSEASSPFIVHTKNLNVKATGTSFNINASPLDKTNQVTLVTGKVIVCKNIPGRKPVEITHMKPNQHLAFDTLSGSYNILEEDTYRYIAWKDGKLIFRNEPMEDVVRRIGYYYHVDLEVRDKKLKEYRYHATFEEESIYEILNLLKLTSPVDYMEIKREPLPDGSFPKKKIIIFPAGTNP